MVSLRAGSLLRSRGLRWGAAVALLLGGSLLAMFGLMFWRSSFLLFETLDRSVLEQVELLAARPPDMLPYMISSRMNHHPAVVTLVGLFAPDGRPIVGDVPAIPAGLRLDGNIQSVVAPDDASAHWRIAGRLLKDGRILVVARPADEILAVRSDLRRGAAIGIVPAILLSLAGGALVGVATERRLRRINGVAERVIAGELAERLPGHAEGDELDRLCAIVNRMLDRFEDVVAALEGVGDNIAHDIRTPLTSLRARLERAFHDAAENAHVQASIKGSIEDVDRALSIMTALLRIADLRHIRRVSGFVAFDLAELAREVSGSFHPVAEDKGIELTLEAHAATTIVADRQLMVEVLVNLVDNAVKFTTTGGHVVVSVLGSSRMPVLQVADSGPGIGPELRENVFKRFYRAEASRTTPGHGLGLSLVAEIARLHRFDITLEDNAPGCRIAMLCWPGSGD